MTKSQIQKIARANGLDISLISVRKCSGTIQFDMADLPADLVKRNIESAEGTRNIPEVERIIKKYNRQIANLIEALKAEGEGVWGMLYGNGAWHYELGAMSYRTRLALDNMD